MAFDMTLADVVNEINHLYYLALKRGLLKEKRGEVFKGILDRTAQKYCMYFGYGKEKEDLSEFKSVLMGIKNNVKRSASFFYKKKFQKQKVQSRLPNEGDGEIFTIFQVEELGLNKNGSYW